MRNLLRPPRARFAAPDARGASAAATAAETRRARLIESRTAVLTPALLPELRFHGAADYADIWTATEADLAADGLPPPFWAFAWPGGQALARFLLDQPERARDRRVLAIGAGAALEVIAAAKSGARASRANDVDPVALTAARLNAALNGVAIALDATDHLAADRPPPDIDLLLLGDAYYERDLSERLDRCAAHAAAAGVEVLLAGPERPHPSDLRAETLAVYDVPTLVDVEDCASRRTIVRRVSHQVGRATTVSP